MIYYLAFWARPPISAPWAAAPRPALSDRGVIVKDTLPVGILSVATTIATLIAVADNQPAWAVLYGLMATNLNILMAVMYLKKDVQ